MVLQILVNVIQVRRNSMALIDKINHYLTKNLSTISNFMCMHVL
jgi:hypothetical protein